MELATTAEAEFSRSQLEDFASFYQQTYPDVYRVVAGVVREPALARDVTHQAYLRAFASRSGYRGDAPASHWMMRIAVNEALSTLRRRKRIKWLPLTSAGNVAEPDPAAGIVRRLAVDVAIERLAPQQRAVVTLRYLHDLDYATIGRILGMTPRHVGVVLSRALQSVRASLREQDDE